MEQLENVRREYHYGSLSREDLDPSPFAEFDHWMQQAMAAGIQDPTAMSIATVGMDYRPSQRTVLLKHSDDRGLVFYTNLESRKSLEIAHNNQVSILFPWFAMDRQVSVEGRAERLDARSVLKYFLTRPRDSQIATWASSQSRKLDSRALLEAEFFRMKTKFQDGKIPLPAFWGGYRIVPDRWEFWQGGEHRLHDRFEYRRKKNSWTISRLAP